MLPRDAIAHALRQRGQSETWQHRTWAQLHLHALRARRAAHHPAAELAWLRRFAFSIPCKRCRSHWLHLVRQHPPEFDRYFAWTVQLHNEVNRQLGKPLLTVPAAGRLWRTRF